MESLGTAPGYEQDYSAMEFKPEKREMDIEQAQEFANAQKVPLTAQNMHSRCVDGRYEGDGLPMIAKPGGDIGDVMVLMAAANELGVKLDPHQALEIVTKRVGGVSEFQCHTDEHAENEHAAHGMGCGHFKKSLLEPEVYGLSKEQTEALAKEVNLVVEQGAHEEVLHGDHAEQAVLVVESDKYGIAPLRRTEQGVQEAFVYQKGVHQNQLKEMAKDSQELLAEQGIEVSLSDMEKAVEDSFTKQLTATLQRLAVGLPVFSVVFDEVGNAIAKL